MLLVTFATLQTDVSQETTTFDWSTWYSAGRLHLEASAHQLLPAPLYMGGLLRAVMSQVTPSRTRAVLAFGLYAPGVLKMSSESVLKTIVQLDSALPHSTAKCQHSLGSQNTAGAFQKYVKQQLSTSARVQPSHCFLYC